VAEVLTKRLNQSVVVENRPGAGGNVAAETVARSALDGYTLLMSSVASNAINATYYKSLSYDLRRDFAPVTKFGQIANGLMVGPGIAANNLAEFTAILKAAPGKRSCASSGRGGLLHLTCEMYKKAAGLDVLHVAYKGATFLPDVISGRVTLVFDNIPVYVPLAQAVKVKILAVTTTVRSPVLPDVPTFAESGVPAVESRGLFGLLAPAATPDNAVQLLSREAGAALNDPALKEKLLRQGIEPEASTPEALRALIDSEIAKWARVMKDERPGQESHRCREHRPRPLGQQHRECHRAHAGVRVEGVFHTRPAEARGLRSAIRLCRMRAPRGRTRARRRGSGRHHRALQQTRGPGHCGRRGRQARLRR
jgi:tripartite-type tricarboxylate transporter receptor subunit TctC